MYVIKWSIKLCFNWRTIKEKLWINTINPYALNFSLISVKRDMNTIALIVVGELKVANTNFCNRLQKKGYIFYNLLQQMENARFLNLNQYKIHSFGALLFLKLCSLYTQKNFQQSKTLSP